MISPLRARLLGLGFFFCASLGGVLFWAHLGAPVNLPDAPEARLHCVSYTPFRGEQTPFDPAFHVPAAQIDEDLEKLRTITDCVRLYATDQGLDQVMPAAERLGMKVLMGAWIGRDPKANEIQLRDVIALARQYPDTVKAIIVGNETLLRGEQPVHALIDMIHRVKAETGKPVTYADVWEFWLKAKPLADAVDFITIHILPYWEDDPVPAADGIAHLAAVLGKVNAAFPGKPVLIGETGFPSAGRMREGAAPSLAAEALYVRSFLAFAHEKGIDYNLIEAFDQPWKRALEGTVGGYWGVYDGARHPKFPLRGPVSNHPFWIAEAAIAILLGLLLLVQAFRGESHAEPSRVYGEALRKWSLAACLAAGGGCALVLQAEHSLVASLQWQERLVELWLMIQSISVGVLVMAEIGRGDAARKPANIANVLATLSGKSWRRFGETELLIGFLALTAALGACLVALGLTFDPRYRDFPIAAFLVPAAGFAALGFITRRRPNLRSDQREEAVLALLLIATALFIALHEGALNHAAQLWALTNILFALPWLDALRRSFRQARLALRPVPAATS